MPVCRRCGQENPPVARLCMVCGTPFPAESPHGREERKVVTALFADLVGFTSRAEQMDVEDVRGTLDGYHALLRRELERHGGTVEKFIGDAVMALFGAPAAHEDDPERAVRAALAIRDAVAEVSAEQPGRNLHVRIGVNTGEALVSVDARLDQGESMAAGDVVNTAARLQAAAPVDGILVGESTHRATMTAIDYRQQAQDVEAKGKSAPLTAWLALEARSRPGLDVRQAPDTPLVGREPQLQMLQAALDQTRRDRTPQLITLVGVPGIGKSRLVWELLQIVDRAPDLVAWRQGRSLPYGEGVTFWAVGEMVQGQAGILETDSEADADAKLRSSVEDLIPDPRDAGWVLRHLRPLTGLGGEAGGDLAESFAAWRLFFEAMAERGPTVLVFEDLHWADDTLLDFVDQLVEWASDVPLLVLGTARPELLDRRPGWGGGKPNSLVVSLAPLSEADTARVISGVLEQSILPAATQASLLTLAEGNPLYAEEYVRMLVDRGLLVQGRGGWSLAADADLPLPESVGGIIAARLDMLPADEKALLQNASVLGKVFWPGALGDASPDRLHALERKQFIRRERHSSVAGETEYVFRHTLMRDVAYSQIPRARRAERHQLAAAWIQELASERPDAHVEMLVHHYGSALEYSRAAGRDTSDLERLARTALLSAGERAKALNALGAAARYFRAAAELWPNDDPQYPHVLLLAGEVQMGAGDMAGAARLQEALPLLRAQGDDEGVCRALRSIAWEAWNRGDADVAERLFEEALETVAGRPPSAAKAAALEEQARRRNLAGRNEEGVALAVEALQIAEELSLTEQRIDCLITLGTLHTHTDMPAGLAELDNARELAGESGYASGLMRSTKNLASSLFEIGEVPRAMQLWTEAAALAERFGDEFELRWFAVERATGLYATGRAGEAARLIHEYLCKLQTGDVHYMESPARRTLAAIYLEHGDVEQALEQSGRATEMARPSSESQLIMPALGIHALVLVAAGQSSRAGAVATELLQQLPTDTRGPWCVEWAAAMAALGRGHEAAAGLEPTAGLSVWERAAVQLAAGELDAARATLDDAGAGGLAALFSGDGPARVQAQTTRPASQ